MSTSKIPRCLILKENTLQSSSSVKQVRIYSDNVIQTSTRLRRISDRKALEEIESNTLSYRNLTSKKLNQSEIKRSLSTSKIKTSLKPTSSNVNARKSLSRLDVVNGESKKVLRCSTSSLQSCSKSVHRLSTQLKQCDSKPIKKSSNKSSENKGTIKKVLSYIKKEITSTRNSITNSESILNGTFIVKEPKISLNTLQDHYNWRGILESASCDYDDDEVFDSDAVIDETIIYDDGVDTFAGNIAKCRCKKPKTIFSGNISQIQPNPYSNLNALITEDVRKTNMPRKKKTLSSRYAEIKKRDDNTPYTSDDYSPEYLEIIINHLMISEESQILKPDFLEMYNPDAKSRSMILNWIVKIQDQLYLNPASYFIVVRLFDHFLANISVPINMYQLLVITITWVINKFNCVKILRISDLLKLCADAYSKEDLCNMERKVVTAINFKLAISEPSDFVEYYLLGFKISTQHQVNYCVYYILEAFTLSPQFSTIKPSTLAEAAVHLTMQTCYPDIYEKIMLNVVKKRELRDVQTSMVGQINLLNDHAYELREPFKKYEKDNYKNASLMFRQMLLKKMI